MITAFSTATESERPRDDELDLFGLTHTGKVRRDNQEPVGFWASKAKIGASMDSFCRLCSAHSRAMAQKAVNGTAAVDLQPTSQSPTGS